MPNAQLSRQIDSTPQTVSTVQSLVSFEGKNDRLKATYTNFTVLADSTSIPGSSFTVERVISTTPELEALVSQLYTLSEQYRAEDEQQRADDLAKREAEAVRWAALTPEQQKAEVQAARDAFQATLSDPTPSGPVDLVAPAGVIPAVP